MKVTITPRDCDKVNQIVPIMKAHLGQVMNWGCPYMEQIWDMRYEGWAYYFVFILWNNKTVAIQKSAYWIYKDKQQKCIRTCSHSPKIIRKLIKVFVMPSTRVKHLSLLFFGLFALNICKKCESTKEILWFLHLIDFFSLP